MKTTKTQYDYFTKKVHEFIEIFGLKDWKIYISWGTNSNNYGECHFDTIARNATIKFCKEATEKLPNYEISRVAFHEVCELFFAEFRVDMDRSDAVVDEIIHRKIRTLENILYPDVTKN